MKTMRRSAIRLVPKNKRDMTYMEYEYSKKFCESEKEDPANLVVEMSWNYFTGERKVR